MVLQPLWGFIRVAALVVIIASGLADAGEGGQTPAASPKQVEAVAPAACPTS